jgi:hypothetical protein
MVVVIAVALLPGRCAFARATTEKYGLKFAEKPALIASAYRA